MWLWVDRESASATANVELLNHFDDFELEPRNIGSDGLGAQEACCETTVLAPSTINSQRMYNGGTERCSPYFVVWCRSNTPSDENNL